MNGDEQEDKKDTLWCTLWELFSADVADLIALTQLSDKTVSLTWCDATGIPSPGHGGVQRSGGLVGELVRQLGKWRMANAAGGHAFIAWGAVQKMPGGALARI